MGRRNGDLQSLPGSGEELVGKEIAIKFKGSGFYQGRVARHLAQTDKYIVAYQDGEEHSYRIEKIVKGIDDMAAVRAKRKGFERGVTKQIRPTSSRPIAYEAEGAASQSSTSASPPLQSASSDAYAGRAQKARASGSYAPPSPRASPVHSASGTQKTREHGASHHGNGRSPSSSFSGPSPFKQQLASSQESMRKVWHSLAAQSSCLSSAFSHCSRASCFLTRRQTAPAWCAKLTKAFFGRAAELQAAGERRDGRE